MPELDTKEEWFLMDCCLPKLQWARLRVKNDGSSQVLTVGRVLTFSTEEEARSWLSEDEYQDLDFVLTSGEYQLPARVVPPQASTDAELQAVMARLAV